MQQTQRVVGVLGGKGPEATVELLNLIIRHTPVNREEDHLRVIVDNNPQIPKCALGLTGEGESPIAALVETAQNVARAGAAFLVIPCNSAHGYIDEIQAALSIPVISIINETVAVVKAAGVARVGLLATTGLLQANLYQEQLAAAGIDSVLPAAERQAELMHHLMRFKDGGDLPPFTEALIRIRAELIVTAEAVIHACTEVPLALADHPADVPEFNTIELLARACVREARAPSA